MLSAEHIAKTLGRGKERRSGNGWMTCCPAHDDHDPSLKVTDDPHGRVLVHCKANCSQESVISALRDQGLWPILSNQQLPTIENKDAVEMWHSTRPADPAHPYLQKKKISPIGIRQLDDRLIIPLRNRDKKLVSIQFIDPDGNKKFLFGTKTSGSYLVLGKPTDKIFICEGYATGVSIHLAVNQCVVVAITCTNLKIVGETIRSKFPNIQIIFAADDDYKHENKNSGITSATVAARAVGGLIAIPKFQGDREGKTDFNDLFLSEGIDAVRKAIHNAYSPESTIASVQQSFAQIEIRSLVGKKPRGIEWLWPQVIPLGELTILYGRGGVGKSTIARSIAAILSNGEVWPASQNKAKVCSSLILEDEDSEDRTLAILQAHGADLSRTPIMGMVTINNTRRPFSISTDMPILEAELKKYPDVHLIILSPINSFIGIDDDKNAFKLRRALSHLNDLVHRTGISVLGIAHPRKGTGGNIQDSLAGSHVWVAAARSVIMALEEPNDPTGARYAGTIKGNYCKELLTFPYIVQQSFVEGTDGNPVDTPKIVWGHENVPERIESIFARTCEQAERDNSSDTADWLEAFLADGPKAAQEVVNAARRDCVTKDSSTLRKALKRIGGFAEPMTKGFASTWMWHGPLMADNFSSASGNDPIGRIPTSRISASPTSGNDPTGRIPTRGISACPTSGNDTTGRVPTRDAHEANDEWLEL